MKNRIRHGITAVILLSVMVYVVCHEVTVRREARAEVEQHAWIVGTALQHMDRESAQAYLAKAIQDDLYEKLVITTDKGVEFYSGKGQPLKTVSDRMLARLGLIPILPLRADVVHEGKVVGRIEANARIKTVYGELYVGIVGVLLILVAHLQFILLNANRELNSKARDRSAKLRVSEESFRSLIESAPEAVFVRSQGRFVYLNPIALRLFGATKSEELLGTDCMKRMAPEYHDIIRDRSRVLGKTGMQAPLMEQEYLRMDGSRVPVETTAVAIRYQGNDARLVFARDITDRRRAEAKIAAHKHFTEQVIQSASEGIVVYDRDLRYVVWNRSMETLTGVPAGRILGTRALDVFPHLREHGVDRLLAQALAGETVFSKDIPLVVSATGKSGWVNGIYGPHRDTDGRILGVIGIVRDVTHRKQAEETLRESEAFRKRVFESSRIPIAVMDPETGQVLDCNPAAATIHGFASREEALGKTAGDVSTPVQYDGTPSLEKARQYIAEAQAKGSIVFEWRHQRRDGSIWDAEVHMMRFQSGERQFLQFTFQDITERKRTDKEREITICLLNLINTSNDLRELMQGVTALLQEEFDCEAVGVRLQDGDDFPYFETRGFPREFVRLENHLCQRDAAGHAVRDGRGNPVLECMCGNVLCDRFDARKPFFTARGSFWSNHTSALLANTSETDRQARTRNRCNGEGYESVALVALRSGNTACGLLQLNDKRKDRFTPGRLALLERLADSIAVAFAHRRSEQHLRKSEQEFRHLYESVRDAFGQVSMERRFLKCNRAFCEMIGYTEEELKHLSYENLTPKQWHALDARIVEEQVIPRGYSDIYEKEYRRKDGTIFPVELRVFLIRNDQGAPVGMSAMARDITERKQTQSALLHSEERYCQLVEQAATGIFQLDPRGHFIFVNSAICQMLGYTQEELLLRTIFDTYPAEEKENAHSRLAAIYRREVRHFDRAMVRKDGSMLFVSASTVALPDGRVQAVVQDITERKRMEEALRASEARFRSLFEGMIEGVAFHETVYNERGVPVNYRILDVNPRFETIVGLKREQVVGKLATEVYGVETAPFLKEYARVGETGEPLFFEADFAPLRKCFAISVAPLGRGLWGTIFFDITERKRVEEETARLTAAIEQAAEAVVITNAQGDIVYANPAFEKTSGYSVDETLGRNPRLLKSGKQDAEFYRRMWETLARGEVWHGRFINRRKDGALYEEEATISPVRDASGRIVNYIALKLDVTRETLLEQQLRQSQKMEAIGQLAGGVAHDFNNILTAILMNVGVLQSGENLESSAREILEDLEAGAMRASNLTRQLLMFSRRSVLEVRVLDLNKVVTGVLKMLRHLLGEHIQTSFKPADHPLLVEADAGMMEQVLMNLAVNARDAMPKGGRIAITAKAVEVGVEAGGHPDRRTGRFVCLSVADTGCGMDEATMKRIFEPFFTTKEPGKGTGLGLATVYGIVAQHHGWVEVDSQVSQGTTFRMFLPVAVTSPTTNEQKGTAAVPTGRETLLVVEDAEDIRRVLVRTLRVLGYRVLEAANGRRALALWKKHSGEIDLLLTDMVMPEGISGLDLAEKIRAEKPGVKIIIASGYSTEMVERGKPADGITYLPKPFKTALLGRTVRDCLDSK